MIHVSIRSVNEKTIRKQERVRGDLYMIKTFYEKIIVEVKSHRGVRIQDPSFLFQYRVTRHIVHGFQMKPDEHWSTTTICLGFTWTRLWIK